MTRLAEALTIRAAVVLGFALTLGLWLLTGYTISSRMSRLQIEAETANSRYMRAQQVIATIRAEALLGASHVREALLDPSAPTIETSARKVQESSSAIDRALAQYVPVADTESERRRMEDFTRELHRFRATLRDVLADERLGAGRGRQMLSQRVLAGRFRVVRLSEDVQALNRRSLILQQAGVAREYGAAARSARYRLGLALAASLGIALLAAVHAGRLEAHLRRQREKDFQSAQDLQRLSARLVSVQEEERRTIARELHDEVGQALTAVKVELSIAQRALAGGAVPASALDGAQTIADDALNTVRDLSRLLHPSILDDLGLAAAADAYVQQFSHRTGIRTELQIDGMDARLAPEIEAAAYRMLQEALTNVARHAGASLCNVRLQRRGDTFTVVVEDNGRGFDAANERHATARGLGLIGIRERVAHLRGQVRLESLPGRGTRIAIEVPVGLRPANPLPEDVTAGVATPTAGPRAAHV